MAYLALARKYRPSTFAEVVGQDHIVRTLSNAIRLDRVHHAFLFTGARGVGKTTTARILARCLNCVHGPTMEPCGVCPSCVEIAAGSSPDVLEIDGASNTGVDNVRELRETVRYLPSRGSFKVYIIDEVHMLSTAAFNALLKTLEEPPPHVKFIFATTEPQKIPVTILSRCQRFDFRRVSTATLVAHVQNVLERESIKLGAGSVAAVVREAQGSVRDALSLLDQVLSYVGEDADDAAVLEALGAVDRQTIFELASAIVERRADRVLELSGEIDRSGHDVADIAGLLVEHFRDLAVAQAVTDPAHQLPDRSPDEIQQLKGQLGDLSSGDLHRIFRLLVVVAEDVARSMMPRVSFEMGLLRALEVEPTPSVYSLLERIDAAIKTADGPTARSGIPQAVSPAREARNASVTSNGEAAEDPVSSRPETLSQPDPAPLAGPSSESKGVAASQSETPDPAWTRFVESVEARRPGLSAVLHQARAVRFESAGVELAYDKGFCLDRAREREHQAQLREELARCFQGETPLDIVEASSTHRRIPTIAEHAASQESERDSQVREEALEHPAVKGVVSILGGEVKEVTSLEPG